MANTYLSHSASGGSRTTWTISAWVKRSKLITSGTATIFNGYVDGSNESQLLFNNDCIEFYDWTSGSRTGTLFTNRKFRDTSAWYHIVAVWDTTNATAGNRMRLYVNGVEETSFSTDTQPSSSQNSSLGNGSYAQQIGLYGSNANFYFDGLMSYVAFVDGTAELPTIFGETDATTGEWKIKTTITPSAGWGTNGFLVLKDGNSVTDESPNTNNFTVGGGTLTNLKDNPSNNFCNINTLYNQTTGQGVTVNNCGNTVYYASDSSRSAFGSIAPSSGKYYFEAKVFDKTRAVIGIVNMAWSNINGASGYAYHDDALNFGYDLDGNKTSGGSSSSFGSALNNNDIVQVAMDLDNSKLYFGINGTWQSSGDPTSGSTGTGSAYNLVSGANYTSACRLRAGTQIGFNFGNGQYSGSNLVTTNSGDGYSGAEGSSKFSYQPPALYSAISTKGLNE
nr:lectin domain containing protein [uncultured Mediterranean phage uvMED]